MSAQSARDTVTLPPVVVTATRLPTAADRLPVSVTVLRGDALRTAGVWTVADALRAVPGAAMVTAGSFGAQTSLFLRGGESDYTKVLIDGVAVNEPGGAFDFAELGTANLDRIEVVRGPASVLYGSDAMTGVVQILTRDRRAPGAPWGTLGVAAGSYRTTRLHGSVAGGSGRFDWSAAGSRERSDGTLPFNNQDDQATLDVRAQFVPGARTRIALSLRYDRNRYHFPTDGAGNLVDRNQFTTERAPTIGVTASRLLSSRVKGQVEFSAHDAELGYDDPPDGPGDTLGFYTNYASRDRLARRHAGGRLDVRVGVATLTVGGAVEREHDRSTDRCTGPSGDCSSPVIDTSRTTASAYTQAVTPIGRQVDLTTGARLDRSPRFGTVVTWRAGLVARPGGGLRLRANAGTGFKEPTFYENFATGFVRGNPDLRGERTRSLEVGVERAGWGGHVTIGVTGFAQRFHDLVDYLPVAPSPTAPNYFNVAAADARGVEVELSADAGPALEGRLSYTRLWTQVTRAGFDTSSGASFAAGAPLLRRPAHSARGNLAWRPLTALRLSLEATYVGHRDDLDFTSYPANRRRLPSYTTVDLAARLGVGAGKHAPCALTLRLQNLTNAYYEGAVHFPAPRRTLMVGADFAVGR